MKNLILLFCFTGLSLASLSQNVVQGEYFIDTDLGYGNNTLVAFTPSADNNFPFTIPLSGFQPGYHKLYFRTKDNNGNWSLTARRNIEVLSSAAKTTITGGEYFIDTDPGFNTATPIVIATPDSIILQNFTAIASGLSEGYHKLYIRTKDSDGKWGLTVRRNIEVIPSASKTTVVTGEYFIDSDPGFSTATPISITSPDSLILQNFTAIASGLSEGYHKLYGRLKDNAGKWGLTFRRNMEVYKSDMTKVVKAEYFFRNDLGFGNCASITFVTPSADGSFSFNIPRNIIPSGADTLFIRVQDDIENRWSMTNWTNGITGALPLSLLDFSVIKDNATAGLEWQTTHEINTAYFNVQRSTDAINFITLGKINAKAGSNLQNDYSYTDAIDALKAGKVYYRLQMMDKDGTFTYSRIIYITINADGTHITLYPNPAHNYFVIKNYENIDIRNAAIMVRDLAGRTFINQKFNTPAGQKVNTTSLSRGLYIVSIIAPGYLHTEKLLIE